MNEGEQRLLNGMWLRQVIVSTLLMGVALVFVLTQRSPGWEPFAAGGLVALVSLIVGVVALRGGGLLGFLAFTILVLGMFWEPGKPWAALSGFILVVLNALKNARIEQVEEEGVAEDDLESTRVGV